MKNIFRAFLLFFVLLFVSASGGYIWWSQNSTSVTSIEEEKSFLIKKGQNAQSIGEDLYEQGFIKSPLAFKIYIQVKGLSSKLPAGEYTISPSYSLSEIVTTFLSGPTELWVSIPEGYRREEIVEKVISTLEIPSTEASEFRSEFLKLTQAKEGYLFPDTYLFPKEVTAQKVINAMEANFEKKVDQKMRTDISSQGRSLAQVIVLASIIERETKTDSERPIVAGLLLARLDEGFLLQTDASLQYALANIQCGKTKTCTNWWPQITRADYTGLSSPYNVYKFQGLPPTPISNPGLSSIKAAVYPQETDYRYYIHDNDGKIHFAKTLDEHNANVSRYLR